MSKAKNQKKHKIAVLTQLLVEALQDVEANSDWALEVLKKSAELQGVLEPVLEHLYQIKGVSSGVYLQDMSNRVDTIIRKNYQLITE